MSDVLHELVWHNDGHKIYLQLEKATVSVVPLGCPFDEDPSAPCYHKGLGGCAVRYFVQMYGLDVNVGIADPMAEMPISWTLQGDGYSVDRAQLWIIPNNDIQFMGFLESQKSKTNE